MADDLAMRYCDGRGCEKDYNKALELVNITSEEGKYSGIFTKAFLYSNGYGVEKDIARAKELLESIIESEQDNPESYWGTRAKKALDEINGSDYTIAGELPDDGITSDFSMKIEDVFSITGRGVVLTGRIASGKVYAGSKVLCYDGDSVKEVEINAIEMFRKLLKRGEIGDNVGILLEGSYDKSEFGKGMWLCSKDFDISAIASYASDEESETEFSESEQLYIETLKESLGEGEITSRERRLLEKLRVKLGLSEERAAELEDSLTQPSLTEEEEEYLAEYRAFIADGGEISPRERKLLNKIAAMNEISPERVKELEAMA